MFFIELVVLSGSLLQEQHSFALRQLHGLGMGNSSILESRIQREIVAVQKGLR